MSASAAPETIADYSGFAFRDLWAGREKVTEIEREVVRRSLAPGDSRRLLEIATGFGRLLPTLVGLGGEVVATDLDAGMLDAGAPAREPARVRRVAANLFHLPFRDGSFTGATMIRVYHHLLEPAAAFRELGRVLQGGARLVVSYKPTPSVGSLVDDIGRALRREAQPFRSITFARRPVVLDSRPFPIRAGGRRDFEHEAGRAGLRVTSESGLGLEEYTPLRRAPARLFVRVGTSLGGAPGFPTRFAVLERIGPTAMPLAPTESILACPRCGAEQPSWWADPAPLCEACGFQGRRSEKVLDLRYVPPGAIRRGISP